MNLEIPLKETIGCHSLGDPANSEIRGYPLGDTFETQTKVPSKNTPLYTREKANGTVS